MRKLLVRLWNDDQGFIVSTELVLVATILVIGLVVGLKAVNLAVNDELSEVASAIGSISQTYAYCGTTGSCAFTRGSQFQDTSETFAVACLASFDTTTLANFTCAIP